MIPTTSHPESSRDGWTPIRLLRIGIRFGSRVDPKEEPGLHTGMGGSRALRGKGFLQDFPLWTNQKKMQ